MNTLLEKLKPYQKSIAIAVVILISLTMGIKYIMTPSGSMKITHQPTLQKPTEKPQMTHIKTPASTRVIYITSWVASQKQWREQLIKFVEKSEINSVIIDIKDYSGYVAFDTKDPYIKSLNTEQIRVKDMKEWLADLHKRGIYTIARITVFQDPIYAKSHPAEAVQTRQGAVWTDKHKLAYVDVASKSFWTYIVHIARAAEQAGFDEVNFDYIRYPTDGNLKDIKFPLSGPSVLFKDSRLYTRVTSNATTSAKAGTKNVTTRLVSAREKHLSEFFIYLHKELKNLGIPMSADVFGMTMTNHDDVGIGQVLESIEPNFDFVCPMVYPSHYPPGFNNFAKPAEHPYEIVRYAMQHGADRLKKLGKNPNKLRPWLQDFNLGAKYDAPKIRAQIKATHDSNLNSYLIWDPRNKYTQAAYLPSKNEHL
ncbi:MAG: hypothetical protein EXS67_00945 [Candidatus Margulisbacteria bacterium]|nr:hypothetical protein [Candidatus Margulisiibacteriota bacterium]